MMGSTAFLIVLTLGLTWPANGQVVDLGLELQSLSSKLNNLRNNLEAELSNVGNEIGNVGNDIDNVGNKIDHLEDEVGDVEKELDDLKTVVQTLRSELQDGLSDLRIEIASCGGQGTLGERWSNPAKSCKQIGDLKPESIPGKFWIENPNGSPVFVECAKAANSPELVSVRVAFIDMTNSTHRCPGGFTEYTYYGSPKRFCARRMSSGGCVSATFSTHGLPYSTVYGRIISYQQGSPSGFYTPRTPNDINSAYIEGISLTHGNPRKHIWSFANALYEATGYDGDRDICPCTHPASTMQQYIPSFVGNDYFCDSGAQNSWQSGFLYRDDPLWDGQGCGLSSTCCQFNNPPYFWKDLPATTTDNIEVRLCADQNGEDEDSPFQLIELYIR